MAQVPAGTCAILHFVSTANDITAPTTVRLPGSGVRLAGDLFGPADGPPVVFLHGGGQTRHSWKRTGVRLAAAGLRVLTVDARGHGDSEWAPDGDYSRHRMVEDLHAVLRTLDRPAVVVGASMGGITALLATAAPGAELIRALVLVDIVVRPEPEGVGRVIDFLGKHTDGFATLDEAADAVAAYLPHRPRPRSTDGLLRNLRRRGERWYWHWDPAMMAGRVEDALDMTDQMEAAARAVTIPVLLVRGGKSDVVSAEGAADFLALVPHAKLAEIGDAAHTAAGDDNDAFTNEVADFVAGIAR